MMKRASYRDAIAWIANNDEPRWSDVEEIAGMISVTLIASIFQVEQNKIAQDILQHRIKNFGPADSWARNPGDIYETQKN
jgi:hypothetical protein